MSILSCVVIFHSCQPVMACWTEIFCWFILNKWIVMFDCICCDSRYLKHNGDEASWKKLGESADLKPHLLSGTWCSWGCRQLLHCERYRCLFYCCPKYGSLYHHTSCDSCCDQCDDKRDAVWKPVSQQPVRTSPSVHQVPSKYRGTGVNSILFVTILAYFGLFGPLSGVTHMF